jgi:hypothetical protein
VATLLIGSGLQMLALFLYLPFDGLVSLYVVSLIFGLSQGGIVPSLCGDRARIHARRARPGRGSGCDHGHDHRHGAGRLDVGLDL